MTRPLRVAINLELSLALRRHTSIFVGTQEYARDCGRWECVVDEFSRETLAAGATGRCPHDGIIARATKGLAEEARRRDVPLVNVWISSPVRDLASVFPDCAAAGRMRAEHLLSRGFRHFGCLSFRGDRGNDQIVGAFRRVVEEKGFGCDVARISTAYHNSASKWQAAQEMILGWMEKFDPPTGVYVASDVLSREFVQLCHNRGLRVPQDVAIVSGDDEPLLCEYPSPSLSSVNTNYERVGYEAARLLDGLMAGEESPTVPILIPPVGIVARESTDFFAVEDKAIGAALEFLSKNSHRPIGVEDVVHAANTSRRTLENLFRDHLGRTVAAEIRRLRIERAKRQLAGTEILIKSIARDAGFGDTKRMIQTFRREVGMTPGEYRHHQQTLTFGE